MMDTTESKPQNVNWAQSLRLARGYASTASQTTIHATKVFLLLFLAFWLIKNNSIITSWLDQVTQAELPGGFKVIRTKEAIKKAESLGANEKQQAAGYNFHWARDAIERAARVAPAIVGAKILWVDDEPWNNARVVGILADLGISVTQVTSTKAAIAMMENSAMDLIISDIGREGEERQKLNTCKIHYFQLPQEAKDSQQPLSQDEYNQKLAKLNADENQKASAGFLLAEKTLPSKIPLIFYADQRARIVRSLCGNGTTDRADDLLQMTISLLEEHRWQRLPTYRKCDGCAEATGAKPVQ